MRNERAGKKLWIVCVLIGMSGFLLMSASSFKGEVPASNYTASDDKSVSKEPTEINIVAVGDIMAHISQIKAQYDYKTKTYDFNNNFAYVKPYIEKADLAICNVETVFAGEKEKYSGFPRFNTPDALADALKNTGFDVAVTANNHSLDRGTAGLLRTIDVLSKAGLTVTGTRKNSTEDNYAIKDVKGVKVGIISYTYETAEYHGKKTLNGSIMPDDSADLINTFNYARLDNDLNNIKNTIDLAKNAGAEVIVLYLHWGDEYKTVPNQYQKQMAQSISNMGADVIFASHPHVLQAAEIIEDSSNLKKTAVFYSLGNFLSNQRYELSKNRHSEDGLIAGVTIYVKRSGGKSAAELKNVEAIPTWVNKYKKSKTIFEILPLDKSYKNRETLIESRNLKRADVSLNNTIEVIGSGFYKQDEMKFVIYENTEE